MVMTEPVLREHAKLMAEVLCRIAAAAKGIETAEEPARETAQDIQSMAYNALVNCRPSQGFTHEPLPQMVNVARLLRDGIEDVPS